MDLSAIALAAGKLFGAKQRGALQGAQRAREDAAAAEQDERAAKLAQLDELVKRDMLETNRVQRDPYGGLPRDQFFKDLEVSENVRAKARELAQQPTAPKAPVVGSPEWKEAKQWEWQNRPRETRMAQTTGEERSGAALLPEVDFAEDVLGKFTQPGVLDALAARAGGPGNFLNSEDGQQLDQAGALWLNNVIIAKSGKGVTDAERLTLTKTYIPQPGDKPAVLAQKRAARERARRGIVTIGGRAVGQELASPSALTAPKVTQPEAALSDADLYEKKRDEGMAHGQAVAYVKARKGGA